MESMWNRAVRGGGVVCGGVVGLCAGARRGRLGWVTASEFADVDLAAAFVGELVELLDRLHGWFAVAGDDVAASFVGWSGGCAVRGAGSAGTSSE